MSTQNENTLSALKTRLDRENAEVSRLTRRDMRSGKGPSDQLRAANTKAKRTWRLWCNADDVEAGRAPGFPVDADGNLIAAAATAKL